MKVLSLFDGISGAMVALERAGFTVDSYYASEIDTYAIAVSKYNYPNIIQLGDITDWENWKDENGEPFNFQDVDLVIAGSPCTNLSKAGNGQGLEGSQSKLFYTFIAILKHMELKPHQAVLLENVKMKKEWKDEMSAAIGFEPVLIDSSLVSAQRRQRLYWSNIGIVQPKDKGISLRDIIFSDLPTVRPYSINRNEGLIKELAKALTICASNWRGLNRNQDQNCVVDLKKLALSKKGMAYMNREVADGRTHWDSAHHSDTINEKSATVVSNWARGVPYNVLRDIDCVREFHPIEVERLQTFEDNYTQFGDFDGVVKEISKTQRLKALGNSFTVDVIAHILRLTR